MTSCGDDDEPEVADKTIVELAQETDELSSLVAALEQADLVDALSGVGTNTVFAPNNDAFQALLDSNDEWNELSDIDNATLTNVLLFHVLGIEVREADLASSYQKSLAEGPDGDRIDLQIDLTDGVKFNGTTEPVTTDIEASNGVIHIVNEVMLPPTIVNLALNNSQFSSLVAAITTEGLTKDYVAILSGDGPFTLFAPTNTAFDALLEESEEWTTLADIPVATLETVLNYHVVSGANVQSLELSDDQTISTLGGDLTTDLTDGAKLETTSGQSVDLILTDVQGANGVIHTVNTVLLPL